MSEDTEAEYSVYDELEDAYTRISVLGREVRSLRSALRGLVNRADEAIKGATEAQLEYLEYHNAQGNCACVTKGLDMAISAIDTYMGAV